MQDASELSSELKVALVADWLTTIGGAERVLKSLHEMFPEAPIYTSQYAPSEIDWFKSADVRTGWLQKVPRALRKFMPILRMHYFAHLDLSEYDLVISSTGAEAKAVATSGAQVNVSYLHAPTQYYWNLYDQYIEEPGFGVLNPLVRAVLKLSVGRLRKSDYAYAQIPDRVVANSQYIAEQIKQYYGRDAAIVFPPVDTERFALQEDKDDYFIITSRHVPWKKVDLAIEACLQTGEKLVVVGSGTQTQRLKQLAGVGARDIAREQSSHRNSAQALSKTREPSSEQNAPGAHNGAPEVLQAPNDACEQSERPDPQIRFVPTISDALELAALVAKAKGFIFPSLEPFGIAPIEALATGTPVLAYKGGGALDFITPENGIFFEEQSVEALVGAIEEFRAREFSAPKVSASAARFSDATFKRGMQQQIEAAQMQKRRKEAPPTVDND